MCPQAPHLNDGHIIRPQVLHPRSIERHHFAGSRSWIVLIPKNTVPPAMSSSRVPSLRASVTACRVDGLAIIGQARGARGIGRVRGSFYARPRHQNPRNAKPAESGGSAYPAKPGKLICLATTSFPEPRRIYASPFLPRANCARSKPLPGGCCCTPEAALLSFVPVTLDLYRTVRRHLHWTLQNLVASPTAPDAASPPSARSPRATGQPRSTVSRHLAQLAEEGVIARQRRPGGVYAYVIAARFLPAQRGVSHRREKGVPPAGTEEQAGKKTGYARARFANRGISFGEIPDDRAKWEARLRAGAIPVLAAALGPKPDRAGLLRAAGGAATGFLKQHLIRPAA